MPDNHCLCKKPRCRPGRPLCRRADSRRNRTCKCGNYHYPHRQGSGLCAANPAANDRMNALVHGDAGNDTQHESSTNGG